MQCNGNKQMIISLGIILISSNIFSWPSSPGKIILGTLARNEAGAVLTKSTQHKPAAWQSWKKQFDSHRHKFLSAPKTQDYNTPWYRKLFKQGCLKHSPGGTVLVSSCSDFLVCTAQKWETSDLRKMTQQIFSTVFATLRKVWIQHITMVGVWNVVNLCSLHTSSTRYNLYHTMN